MALVPSFTDLLQAFAPCFTAPSYANFTTLVAGWLFARRHTVCGCLVAAGDRADKHFGTYHRFFSSARWQLEQLGLHLVHLLEPYLEDDPVLLALDDTLARKQGRRVYGAGMHHDPLVSSRRTALCNWGHSWVVLAVVCRLPFCSERFFALPVLFRLYLNKSAARKARRVYRTRPELGLEMLERLAAAFPERRFHCLADRAYGGQDFLRGLPAGVELTSSMPLNTRLCEPPPAPTGRGGRPRKRGEPLPRPEAMLTWRGRRHRLEIYGRHEKVKLVEQRARMHNVPERPLVVVAVHPLGGGRRDRALYSTLDRLPGREVLELYSRRWSIEVSFHDAKGSLGFEEPQGWSQHAVRRTAPLAMLLYSLVLIWFAREGHRLYQPPRWPWYPHKRHASFADMLMTLRRASLQATLEVSRPPGAEGTSENLTEALWLALEQVA